MPDPANPEAKSNAVGTPLQGWRLGIEKGDFERLYSFSINPGGKKWKE
jgi:hypothetical protein